MTVEEEEKATTAPEPVKAAAGDEPAPAADTAKDDAAPENTAKGEGPEEAKTAEDKVLEPEEAKVDAALDAEKPDVKDEAEEAASKAESKEEDKTKDADPAVIDRPEPVDDGPSDAEILIAELKSSLASSQTLLQSQASRLATLHEVETQLAQVKDQLVFVTAAKDAVEKRLAEEKDKRESAEEQMEALRGQVEAARRGVGLLHKQSEMERKRYSQIGGIGGLGGLSAQGLGLISGEDEGSAAASGGSNSLGVTDKASKRQSMIRASRIVSDGDSASTLSIPTNTGAQPRGLRELRLGAGAGPGTSPAATSPTQLTNNPMDEHSPSARRLSNASRTSVTAGSPKKESSASMVAAGSADAEETQKLRAELVAVHRKLEESEEARIASEACLKALREFVALGSGTDTNTVDLTDESSAGLLKGLSLPPLPTDKDTDADAPPPAVPAKEMSSPKKAPASSWGFNKLWRQNSALASPAPSTGVEPPQTPQPLLSPAASGRTADLPRSSNASAADLDEPHVAAVPAATPRNFISSWTRAVAAPVAGASSSVSGTPAPGASTPSGVAASGTPVPPTNTRKLSSFFGIGKREDSKDASTDFEAGDAFTPQHPAQDKLEPSLMVDEHDEDKEAERIRAEANRLSKEVEAEHASIMSEAGEQDAEVGKEAKEEVKEEESKGDKEASA